MTERRRKQPMSWQKYALIALAIILAIATMVAATWYTVKFFQNRSSDDAIDTTSTSQDVSQDTIDTLNKGTVLNFGDSTKKSVYLIVDPADLSRSKPLINGRPSKLLTAVQKNQIYLHIYLAPSTSERGTGVSSMIKASVCATGNDRTPNHLTTLLAMVKAADKFQGTEDPSAGLSLLGMKSDTTCVPSSKELSKTTSDNARYFTSKFSLDPPRAIIAGDSLVTDIDNLSDEWVDNAIAGGGAKTFLKDK